MPELIEKIKALANQFKPDVVNFRRHLHAHPELSFREFETTAYIASVLGRIGIEIDMRFSETGLVGHIYGNNPSAKTIAIRADIDALPILEENKVDYASKVNGVMHACGHDVHTASQLGTAMILQHLKSEFEGTIKLIFQPGEEVLPGGASKMIQAGVLQHQPPSRIFAQHVFPTLETGKVGFRVGKYMASTDELHIEVVGKGGHAALPNSYNNPLLMASALLLELNQLFQPYFNLSEPTVLAFGKIEGLGATNIIPEKVLLQGTLRTLDEKWRQEAHGLIREACNKIAIAYNGKIVPNIIIGYPCLVNDAQATFDLRKAAENYLGKENVVDLDLRMTAEDFSYFSHELPACFYRLGTGNRSKGITANVHTSTFDIDEEALEIGMGLMAYGVLSELNTTISNKTNSN